MVDLKDLIQDEEVLKQVNSLIEQEINKYKEVQSKQMETINNLKKTIQQKDNEIITIKDIIGIDKDTPINAELIKSKFKDDKDLTKIESKYNEIIAELNKKFEAKENEYKQQLENLTNEKRNLILEGKIKNIPNINNQDGALDDIVRYLKENATIDDVTNNIVYKNGDDIIRNDKGLPLTIEEKLNQLKNTKKYLFKTDVQVDKSTTIPNNYIYSNSKSTDFASRMRQRALQLGIKTY
jgi:hypothetical protein